MAIINLGSVNVDHVYQVVQFVQPGETIASVGYQKLLGGKGANQSIALAKAGAETMHIGRLHESDSEFKQRMIRYGVNCKHLCCSDTPSGHAIIQVDSQGENAIVLFPGANHELTGKEVQAALSDASPSDWLLLQNETSAIGEAMQQAKNKGMRVAFNPAPMTASVKELVFANIDLLIVNQHEAAELANTSNLPEIESYFRQHWPHAEVIITLGQQGVVMLRENQRVEVAAFSVDAVDTTAAGDTFIGYFLAAYADHQPAEKALRQACAASALAVTQVGAAQSIPDKDAVERFLAKNS